MNEFIRAGRMILATVLMFVAALFKFAMIWAAPKDLKESFKNNV